MPGPIHASVHNPVDDPGSMSQPAAGSCKCRAATTGNTMPPASAIQVKVLTAFSSCTSASPISARPCSSTCTRMCSGSAYANASLSHCSQNSAPTEFRAMSFALELSYSTEIGTAAASCGITVNRRTALRKRNIRHEELPEQTSMYVTTTGPTTTVWRESQYSGTFRREEHILSHHAT